MMIMYGVINIVHIEIYKLSAYQMLQYNYLTNYSLSSN